jgi:hypothetical protein
LVTGFAAAFATGFLDAAAFVVLAFATGFLAAVALAGVFFLAVSFAI